jgi:hypothetical protein
METALILSFVWGEMELHDLPESLRQRAIKKLEKEQGREAADQAAYQLQNAGNLGVLKPETSVLLSSPQQAAPPASSETVIPNKPSLSSFPPNAPQSISPISVHSNSPSDDVIILDDDADPEVIELFREEMRREEELKRQEEADMEFARKLQEEMDAADGIQRPAGASSAASPTPIRPKAILKAKDEGTWLRFFYGIHHVVIKGTHSYYIEEIKMRMEMEKRRQIEEEDEKLARRLQAEMEKEVIEEGIREAKEAMRKV